jgi:AraC-like DNA-binding protein
MSRVARSVTDLSAFDQACAFLGANAIDAPGLGVLARMANMSRSRFSRRFHDAVGISMRAYVTSRRLRLASDLLQNSKCSITVIALECGFYDLPHFDKVFRRRFGISPHEFRCGRSPRRRSKRGPGPGSSSF